MDLFASNGVDSTLYDTVSNIKVKTIYQKAKNDLKNILFNMVTQQRQLYFASFGLSTEFNLLDNITRLQLIKYLDMETKKIITCQRPVVAQSVNILLTYIQQNQDIFADAVCRFMSIDPTYHFKFAFCCFPAIYGYFCTKQLMANACTFICSIIDSSSSFFINSLISSLFLSAHRFNDAFSYSLCQKISYDFQEIDIFLCCAQCLTQSFPLLTPEHTTVLRYYLNRKYDEAIKYILQNLIPKIVSLCKNNFSHRCNSYKIDRLCDFIKNLQNDDQGTELIIKIITNVDGQYILPNLPPFEAMSRIPYALTFDDVSLFCEILNTGTTIDEALTCLKNKNFKEDFSPIIVEVLTLIPQLEGRHQNITDIKCFREFNSLNDRANRLNIDVFQLYEKEKETTDYFRDQIFGDYLEQMKIKICTECIESLGDSIDIICYINCYKQQITDSFQTFQILIAEIYDQFIRTNQTLVLIDNVNLVYGAALLDQPIFKMPNISITDISFDMKVAKANNISIYKWINYESYIDQERNSSIFLHIMHVARSIIYANEHGYKSLKFPQIFGEFIKKVLSPQIAWTMGLVKQYIGLRIELREVWGKENEIPFIYVLSCTQNIESDTIETHIEEILKK